MFPRWGIRGLTRLFIDRRNSVCVDDGGGGGWVVWSGVSGGKQTEGRLEGKKL